MIFLVEDDDETRNAICLLLDCEAIPVRAFPSCDALLKTVDFRTADCLILDVHMNGMTGLDLLEHVRKVDRDVPVIMMTGGLSENIKRRTVAAAAFAVLEKPFNGNELIDTIQLALAEAKAGTGDR
jgi:FixJ family two-component response regulator